MKIGLLNPYVLNPAPDNPDYEYGIMFRDFFETSVSSEWALAEYVVSQGCWPGALHECDGYIIAGSPKSVYERGSWIMKLMEFACGCHANRVPLVGICFGHQVIAQALGGGVHKSLKGWGVGVREFKVLSHKPWMEPQLSYCSLLFSHQDQVEMLPHGATLLGSDGFCLHQMYAIDDHIFALQGHPEFTQAFMRSRLEERKERIGEAEYRLAMSTLENKTDAAVIGQWIRRFFELNLGSE
jgi:GMP synthase-like glutamine amidotransferase